MAYQETPQSKWMNWREWLKWSEVNDWSEWMNSEISYLIRFPRKWRLERVRKEWIKGKVSVKYHIINDLMQKIWYGLATYTDWPINVKK